MEKISYSILIFLSTLWTFNSCQNSGGIILEDSNGSSFQFGQDKMTNDILGLAEAYSERNPEKLFTFYSDSFLTERRKEWSSKYLNSLDSLYMKPYKIIPLKSNDGKFKEVIAWSKEERKYKNGSYEKLDLFEQFVLDDSGKVNGFRQWKAIDSVNFGMPYGGKFFGKKDNEYSGRPLVFSNRGEVAVLEKLVADYNSMNTDAFKEAFADEFTFENYQGKSIKFKKNDIEDFFKSFESVNWEPISIVPLKIQNTDAASGVIVYSTETRVLKNGKKWEKELMEMYYFDLDMKITSMIQFAR